MALRIRMFGGSNTGYARMTRRWWAPVSAELNREGLTTERPLYFVSSNTHSLVNIATSVARDREQELVAFVETMAEDDILRHELAAFREGRSEGSWENFLYFVARIYFATKGRAGKAERRDAEKAGGVTHMRSTTALRVPAQILPLAALRCDALDPRIGEVDADALAASEAVIVNIDYPLGLAAYNILREVAVDRAALRGVYVLGKAATLNADVGDVMISSVVHDEHSNSTYWLDNAFGVDDLAGDLRFGTGLDNQRAVTVKSTFLQNRSYLDFYYREAYTVVEMEAGPFCNAVYEIADADRHPVGEAVNFSKLPIDLGIIHYASDTPYTQARTLGARGLSYYGMDSTYAGSLAILRRVLMLEGVLNGAGPAGVGPRRRSLRAHRMPCRLQLRERVDALQRVGDGGFVAGHGVAVARALDRLGGQPVELGAELGIAAGIDDRVEVTVRAQRGGELGAPAREEVDHPARDVGDAQHLGQVQPGQRLASDRIATTVFPAASAGAISATRPSSSGSSGATTPTTPVGSGSEKDRNGAATGLIPPRTAWNLSVQPA